MKQIPRKIILLAFFSFLLLNNLFAQQSDTYSRSSISTVFLQHAGDNLSFFDYVNSAQIPGKYDYNYYGDNSMNVSFQMVSLLLIKLNSLNQRLSSLLSIKNPDKPTYSQIRETNSEISNTEKELSIEKANRYNEIKNKIAENKLSNKVLASILIDKNLGYMTTDIIAKRGLYNASDAEYLTAMNSERKAAAIMDKGQDLLKNTYFFVFDITNYSITSADEKDSRLQAYNVTGNVYLIKIRIDSLMANGEFNNLVFTEPDPVKMKKFEEYNFPFQVLYTKSFSASTNNYKIDKAGTGVAFVASLVPSKETQNNKETEIKYIFKTDSEIEQELVNKSINEADVSFTAVYEPFKVTSGIYSNNPLSIKIGSKESLRKDDLYKVSENRISKSGIKSEKKIGWIRAKKVAKNNSNATGASGTSLFYKVASKKIERGMKVQYKPEKGIVFGAGYNYSINNNSIMSGPMIQIDYITHLIAGLRVGIGFGGFLPTETKQVNYDSDGANTGLKFSGTNMYADLTIQKIFQANRLEFTPYLGGYYATLSMDKWYSSNGTEHKIDDKSSLKGLKNTQYGVVGGVKLGYNFGRHFQLNVGYKYGYGISDKLTTDNGDAWVTRYSSYDVNKVKVVFDQGVITGGLRLFGF